MTELTLEEFCINRGYDRSVLENETGLSYRTIRALFGNGEDRDFQYETKKTLADEFEVSVPFVNKLIQNQREVNENGST